MIAFDHDRRQVLEHGPIPVAASAFIARMTTGRFRPKAAPISRMTAGPTCGRSTIATRAVHLLSVEARLVAFPPRRLRSTASAGTRRHRALPTRPNVYAQTCGQEDERGAGVGSRRGLGMAHRPIISSPGWVRDFDEGPVVDQRLARAQGSGTFRQHGPANGPGSR